MIVIHLGLKFRALAADELCRLFSLFVSSSEQGAATHAPCLFLPSPFTEKAGDGKCVNREREL
jgi:hypothetical protein